MNEWIIGWKYGIYDEKKWGEMASDFFYSVKTWQILVKYLLTSDPQQTDRNLKSFFVFSFSSLYAEGWFHIEELTLVLK